MRHRRGLVQIRRVSFGVIWICAMAIFTGLPALGQGVPRSVTLVPHARTALSIGPDTAEFSNTVTALAYAPDGRTLAVSLRDPNDIVLLDAATLAIQGRLEGHLKMVARLAYLPDGKTLVSSGHDGTVRFWDVAAKSERLLFDQFQGNVRGLAVSPNGERVVGGDFVPGNQGSTKVINARDGQMLGTLENYRHGIEDLAISPDSTTLASTSRDQTIRLWDLVTRKQKASFEIKGAFSHSVTFGSQGRDLASVFDDRRLVVFDAATLKPRYQVQVPASTAFILMAATTDGSLLATSDNNHVWLYRAADGVVVGSSQISAGGHIYALAFSPDGQTLAIGGPSGSIRILRLDRVDP